MNSLNYTTGDEYADSPFTLSTPTRIQDLLAALPPTRQCDERKDVFFQVFSHVRFPIPHNCRPPDHSAVSYSTSSTTQASTMTMPVSKKTPSLYHYPGYCSST